MIKKNKNKKNIMTKMNIKKKEINMVMKMILNKYNRVMNK
jgi:hypothetical protein